LQENSLQIIVFQQEKNNNRISVKKPDKAAMRTQLRRRLARKWANSLGIMKPAATRRGA
jgi:hypothetical protein